MAVEDSEQSATMTNDGLTTDLTPLAAGIYSLLLPTNEEDIQQTLTELECYLNTGTTQVEPQLIPSVPAMGNTFPSDQALAKQTDGGCLYTTTTTADKDRWTCSGQNQNYSPLETLSLSSFENEENPIARLHKSFSELDRGAPREAQLAFMNLNRQESALSCFPKSTTNPSLPNFKHDSTSTTWSYNLKPELFNSTSLRIENPHSVSTNLPNMNQNNVPQQWNYEQSMDSTLSPAPLASSLTASNPNTCFVQGNYTVSQLERNCSVPVNSGYNTIPVSAELRQSQQQVYCANQTPFVRAPSFEEQNYVAPLEGAGIRKGPNLLDLDSQLETSETRPQDQNSNFMDLESRSLQSTVEIPKAYSENPSYEGLDFTSRRGSDLSESSFASPDSSRSSHSDSENEAPRLQSKCLEYPDCKPLTPENDIFRCSYNNCAQQFSQGSQSGSCYKRTHGGDKPFCCPWRNCGWRFRRSDELKRHYRRHTGEKPYACPLCGRAFSRSDHRASHMRKLHPNCLNTPN